LKFVSIVHKLQVERTVVIGLYPKGGRPMKKWINVFIIFVVLAFFFSGCAVGESHHGYIRDENPAFSVNESHGLDYYQMYGP
jgi:hypothetical protein